MQISVRAAEQYHRRIKAGLELDAARAELERLVPLGEVPAAPPEWANPKDAPPYWLLLGDDIVLPLKPQHGRWMATTCLAQQTLNAAQRDAKSARKASFRSRKRRPR